jgi:pyrroline-5-carboxylate reductase
MKTLGFIGGGRVTRILLNGFKNANVKFEKIGVFETDKTVSVNLKSDFPEIQTFEDDLRPVLSAEMILLALHPPKIMETLQSVNSNISESSVIISLAPKITIRQIQAGISRNQKVIRMIPNAGSYINKGYNPVCFADEVSDDLRDEMVALFEKVGKVPVVEENQLEGYAMISAMGHTYFWFQFRHLRDLALQYGIPGEDADESIYEMVRGTIDTLFKSGLTYEQVIDLIPVKPIADSEKYITDIFTEKLNSVYNKIKV